MAAAQRGVLATREALVARLAGAGFVAPEEEADELLAAAAASGTPVTSLLERRLTGEPLAWITGSAVFGGVVVRVDPGVYVPRFWSEELAARAAARLPASGGGVAVEVCCGSGAIGAFLRHARPACRVLGTDVSVAAVACAAANGVEAYVGDLFAPLDGSLRGEVDVVVGVVPYVPTGELALLQRDTLAFESAVSYDGGADGMGLLRRVVDAAPAWLRPGGALLLELGGSQADALQGDLHAAGFGALRVLADEDGDVRGIEATLA